MRDAGCLHTVCTPSFAIRRDAWTLAVFGLMGWPSNPHIRPADRSTSCSASTEAQPCKTLGTGFALATLCGVTAASPADAATVTRDSCAPTFTTVVGLSDAVTFLEAAFGRALTPDELEMTVANFVKLDRNADQTICLKIAADSPGLDTPVPQAIDNLTQRARTSTSTVSSTDATTENKIMNRQPGAPPRGRTWTLRFPDIRSAQSRGSLSRW